MSAPSLCCPHCYGDGKIACPDCGGDGVCIGTDSRRCGRCAGEGTESCGHCRGFGDLALARAEAERVAWCSCPPPIVQWITKHVWRPMAGDGPVGDSVGTHTAITLRLRPTPKEREEMRALKMVKTRWWSDSKRPGVEEWQWTSTGRAMVTRAEAPRLEASP